MLNFSLEIFIYKLILLISIMLELKDIKVKKKVYNSLKKLKVHPRESFNDVLQRLIKNHTH